MSAHQPSCNCLDMSSFNFLSSCWSSSEHARQYHTQHGLVLGAEELRHAIRALGKITGKVDVEDLLDVIFRDFCIGKWAIGLPPILSCKYTNISKDSNQHMIMFKFIYKLKLIQILEGTRQVSCVRRSETPGRNLRTNEFDFGVWFDTRHLQHCNNCFGPYPSSDSRQAKLGTERGRGWRY
jgi:hypothetical protein